MEIFLHYVWKHKLYATNNFKTVEGQVLEVIDPGIYNTDAGPDFFNAKIRLDGQVWAGNIEMHCRSSDWYHHSHDVNKAYNSTILHVVEVIDAPVVKDASGRFIPQWVMPIPEKLYEQYTSIVKMEDPVPCLDKIKTVPEIYLSDWKTALLTERLERKTQTILQLLDTTQGDWKTVFYITLARNFGFGINNDAFERLAKSLPLKYIFKHAHSSLQIEALLLGQAGLLDEDAIDDTYYICLKSEYEYLQKKYSLTPLENQIFKRLRLRPNNFPHVKIVQLAGFVQQLQSLFAKVLTTNGIENYRKLFKLDVSDYWQSHYHFQTTADKKSKPLGQSAIDILLINTVSPILFAYGCRQDNMYYKQKAFDLLNALPPERNAITHLFMQAGVKNTQAGDSQALIQLKKEYCEHKKCIFCRIGHRILNKNV
ncbi:hypothetical protein AGMMS49525_11350 [Bacteroidia bacterium]|nr:hypothetical protein AGMMS49525_11350 [Bacteroidia bacterium]